MVIQSSKEKGGALRACTDGKESKKGLWASHLLVT